MAEVNEREKMEGAPLDLEAQITELLANMGKRPKRRKKDKKVHREEQAPQEIATPEPAPEPEPEVPKPEPEAATEPEPESISTPVKKGRKPSVLRDLLFLILKVGAIALTLVLLFTFLFGLERYQDSSMMPAMKDGDLVIYYRFKPEEGYLPQDVIMFDYEGQVQARRVLATAGDYVDISPTGGLLINGALQQEPEIYHVVERYEEGVDFPLTVPEGEVFVMGDFRTNATDSRVYGCVKIADTRGKVIAVLRRRGI